MRKKVFITGGLLALMLILSSSTAFAQSLKLSSDEISTIKTEITAGKPIKDVLKSHNITMSQIKSALGDTGYAKEHFKLTNTQIAAIATKLGLDMSTVQSEIDAGKSLPEILKAHNITPDQLKSVLGSEMGHEKNMKKDRKMHKSPKMNKSKNA